MIENIGGFVNKNERISRMNIVDQKLDELVKIGSIKGINETTYCKEFGGKIKNLYSQRYWDRFINLCNNEIIDYVLSMPQTGNWNGWLYASCEKRKGIKPNR
jgi:hypothetical protein